MLKRFPIHRIIFLCLQILNYLISSLFNGHIYMKEIVFSSTNETIFNETIKDPKIKTNKTFTKQDFCQIDKNDKLSQDFSLLGKRKKVKSAKKIYIGEMTLKNSDKNLESFPFYRDEDIGIIEEWQEFIIEANMDEDCETDEELILKLNDIVYNDLEEGINLLKNHKDSPQELLANFRGI